MTLPINNILKSFSSLLDACTLLNISKSSQLPLIATQEVFYLSKEMYEAHDALVCIGEKKFVDDKERFKYSNHHYLKSQNLDFFKTLTYEEILNHRKDKFLKILRFKINFYRRCC